MLKEIVLSIQSYFNAHEFIKQHKLWNWIIILGSFYAIIFGTSMYFFVRSATSVITYLTIDTGLQIWLDKLQSSWLGFLFAVGGVILWLNLMLLYFSLFKYIWLIIGSPVFSILSEKTAAIMDGKDIEFNLNKYISDVFRGIKLAVRNTLWQTVYIISIILFSFLPLIGWASPILAIIIECYYYGFSMLDYSCERNKMSVGKSIDFIGQHKGLAIGNGIIFYMMHFVVIIGWVFAPAYAVIAATIAMHQLKSKETSFR